MAGSHGNSKFSFVWKTKVVFFIIAANYIPTNSVREFLFLYTLSDIYYVHLLCTLFNDGHSDLCEVTPHFSFELHCSAH